MRNGISTPINPFWAKPFTLTPSLLDINIGLLLHLHVRTLFVSRRALRRLPYSDAQAVTFIMTTMLEAVTIISTPFLVELSPNIIMLFNSNQKLSIALILLQLLQS